MNINDEISVGISKLSPILSRHRFLKQINLSDNKFGDKGAEVLLKGLADNGILEFLNLDRCELSDCQWAAYISRMDNLKSLNLACNNISDIGLQELCRHLEKAACLNYLSLANNNFGERAISLGSLIQQNAGLIELNLSGNHFQTDGVNGVAFGITQNKSLVKLNMTNCNILEENIRKLCLALCDNLLVELVISGNPIDIAIQNNPRAYGFMMQAQINLENMDELNGILML